EVLENPKGQSPRIQEEANWVCHGILWLIRFGRRAKKRKQFNKWKAKESSKECAVILAPKKLCRKPRELLYIPTGTLPLPILIPREKFNIFSETYHKNPMGKYDRAKQQEKRDWTSYNRNPFSEPLDFGHPVIKVPKLSSGNWRFKKTVKRLPHIPEG